MDGRQRQIRRGGGGEIGLVAHNSLKGKWACKERMTLQRVDEGVGEEQDSAEKN
jgi:hypothetical protein